MSAGTLSGRQSYTYYAVSFISPLHLHYKAKSWLRAEVQLPGLEDIDDHCRQQHSQARSRRRHFRHCVDGVQRWAIS